MNLKRFFNVIKEVGVQHGYHATVFMPECKTKSRFIAMASPLIARRWVRPQTL